MAGRRGSLATSSSIQLKSQPCISGEYVGLVFLGPGIRGTQVLTSVRMKKTQESSKWIFLGTLIPEKSQRPRISLGTSHSNESALNPIGGLF